MEQTLLALLISTAACHTYRSRHSLEKIFLSLASLFEAARRCMQRARKVGDVQSGGGAASGHGGCSDRIGQGRLKLPFVFRQRCARQRSARAHEIGGIGAEGADEPAGPLLAGSDNAALQTILCA